MRHLLIIIFSLFLCLSISYSQDSDSSVEDSNPFDSIIDFKTTLSLAEDGYVSAQYNLGLWYYKGDGVKQDYEQAIEWFSRAAQQDNSSAQFNLGLLYYKGEGVVRDYEQASEWYRRSAQQGDYAAQYNLGLMYYKGEGVVQDYKQAFEFFRLSASQGYVSAQFNLGKMYFKGEGIEKDYIEAIEWFTKSAEGGDTGAQEILDMIDEILLEDRTWRFYIFISSLIVCLTSSFLFLIIMLRRWIAKRDISPSPK